MGGRGEKVLRERRNIRERRREEKRDERGDNKRSFRLREMPGWERYVKVMKFRYKYEKRKDVWPMFGRGIWMIGGRGKDNCQI